MIVDVTARTDLLQLHEKGVLNRTKRGKTMIFTVPPNFPAMLRKLAQLPD